MSTFEKPILKASKSKIIFIGIILGSIFICFSGFLAYQYMGETEKQRLQHLKQMVQVARNSIEPVLVEYRDLNITTEKALEQVRNHVRKMVYTDHLGKNYIFMSSYDGIMLVQPFEPNKEMTDMWNLKDAHGLYIIKALVGAANSLEGEGYVSYYYQRPGEKTAQEKISFVIGIPELGCYIGTGQYMGDIRKSQQVYLTNTIILTSVLMILLFSLLWTSIQEISTQNAKLLKAERELTAIFDNAFQFIGSLTPEGILKRANRTALELIGKSEVDVVGKPFWETPWWKGEELQGRLKNAIHDCSNGKVCRFEAVHEHQIGGIIHVDFILSPVFDEDGVVVWLLAEGRNISEQTEARNELIKEKVFFENIIQSIPGLFFLYKQEGKHYLMKKWNSEQHEKILGYSPEDLNNAEITSFVNDENLPILNNLITKVIKTGSLKIQLDTKTKDNRKVPVLYLVKHFTYSGSSYLVGTGIELTEKIQAEEEKKALETLLAKSQKMESLGTLAGGIAHDFNNILSAVLGYAELVIEDLPAEDPAIEKQKQVIKAAVRAKDLVSQILLFSRQSELEMQPVQLEMIIIEVLKLIRSTIPTTVEIKQNIPSNSGTILADPTQIHQIIMNLCTNAYYAMRESGGIMEVSLTEIKISDEEFVHSDFILDPGNYLRLEVRDTGHGMDSATLNKIFDPYFTTKEKGEGTGLGLSVVHGIVKNYGGEIKVYSELGLGTSVHVFFPKFDEADKQKAQQTDNAIPTGNEHLLLVDDDQTIVDMMKQSLSPLGYQISSYISSKEALEAFRLDPYNFDLVITDMTMPQMTGMELSKRILEIQPQTPIILCTGYSELITREKAKAIGIRSYLLKPVLRQVLTRTIREVLDESE
jgi:PAS domain S-box-containing protein